MRQWIEILNEKRGPVMPLATYIARNGGLELNGDTRAADFHRLYVPGAGPLARKSGKSIDGFWRENLIAAGWLPEDQDGYAQRDIRKELFDKLHDEQRARMFGSWSQTGDDDTQDGEHAEFEAVKNEVRQALIEIGQSNHIDDSLLHDAAMLLWNRECEDPLDAYERAAMASQYHNHMGDQPKTAARQPAPAQHLPPDDDVPF